jgi:hypothetical protein
LPPSQIVIVQVPERCCKSMFWARWIKPVHFKIHVHASQHIT